MEKIVPTKEQRILLRTELARVLTLKARTERELEGISNKLDALRVIEKELKKVLDVPHGRWEQRKVLVRA